MPWIKDFLLCCSIALSLLPLAWAGSGLQSLRFEHLGPAQMGQHSIMLSAVQDSQGVMWLGTDDGLLRYDGRRGRLFSPSPTDPHSLSHPDVHSQLLLGADKLLLGTGGGLDEFDLLTETVRRIGLPGERRVPISRRVAGLAPAGAHQVWVQTPLDLLRYDTERRSFSTVEIPDLSPWSPGRPLRLSGLSSDGQGGVWLVAGHELIHLDREQKLQQRWPLNTSQHPDPYIRHMVLDGQGGAWIGVQGGLQVIDTLSGRQLDLPQRLGLPKTPLHAVLRDAQGSIWLGFGAHGLWRWRPGSAAAEQHSHHPAVPESLSSPSVSGLFQDRSGVLWVGSFDGKLSLVDLNSGGFRNYLSVVGDASSLSNETVMAVQPAGPEHVWAATYGGGLNRLHLASGRAEQFPLDTLPMPYQKALLLQPGRGLWVGGDSGLFLLDPDSGQVRRIALGETLGGGISIASIALDAQGDVWAGSAGGVYRIRPDGQLTRFRRKTGDPLALSNEVVDSILVARDGRLWLGTKGGLQLWDAQAQGFTQPVLPSVDLAKPADLIIKHLRQDAQGRIWVGSQLGLFELLPVPDQKDRWQLKSWRGLAGMPAGSIYGLENALDGALWFASERGLCRLDTERKTLRNYPSASGPFNWTYSLGGSAVSADGRMFYGGAGLLQFSPEGLRDNLVAPPLVLADIRVFNRSLVDPLAQLDPTRTRSSSPSEAASSLGALGVQGPLALARAIRLTQHEAMVSFDLRAMHYYSPSLSHYAWRLEGFDADWIAGPPGEGLATYTNLDPGRYRLLAKAANPDGAWGEPRQMLEIEVLPPWWRSLWFRVALAVSLALSVAAAWHWRLRALKLEQERLEAKVARRTAQVQSQRQQIATLSEIGRELTASLDAAAIQATLHRHVEALMPANVFGLGILNRAEGFIAFDFVIDHGQALKPYRRSLDAAEQPAALCVMTGEPQLIREFMHDNRAVDAGQRTPGASSQMLTLQSGAEPTRSRSGLYVALSIKGVVEGVISVLSDQPDAYSQTHLDILQTLAASTAVALDNADAYRQLKRTQAKLVEQEKMASLGALVAGVAHELNTPLGNGLMAASTLQDGARQFAAQVQSGGVKRSELQAFCEKAELSTELLMRSLSSSAQLVSSFKQLAVDRKSEPRRPFELNELALELRLALASALREGGHDLQLVLQGDLVLDSYPGSLGLVLKHLGSNALIHGFAERRGGLIRLSAERLPGDRARLVFSDDGQGIAPEHLAHIFDPFFTTRMGHGSNGLGLHLCYSLVHSMLGGEISVSSTPGQGTVFEMLLPLSAPRD
ncbi:two-component regulator propeller domain-containing protein [Roseateles oligotrophus]|uniref:histidine kinase n=1 Tax=Roseateles oligotrophus TaxID=1769250 RepID=A0ABT2YJG6_9BURK|nr:two-component regulator propeller domain-containing protein [Roseateles oligotrophus]MCV2370199.1 hypothetical protein [Roseateles oligotrophus]